MTQLSGLIKPNGAPVAISNTIKQSPQNLHPCPPGLLQRFASHKVAPAIVNYTAGALVFAGAALFFTGFGTLPGIILLSVGSILFATSNAAATCNLPADIGSGDYLEFCGQCFVWGLCFIFTLPTILLLKISVYFSVSWLLQNEKRSETNTTFSTELSWLMAPPVVDKLPDSVAFSGLEVA